MNLGLLVVFFEVGRGGDAEDADEGRQFFVQEIL